MPKNRAIPKTMSSRYLRVEMKACLGAVRNFTKMFGPRAPITRNAIVHIFRSSPSMEKYKRLEQRYYDHYRKLGSLTPENYAKAHALADMFGLPGSPDV